MTRVALYARYSSDLQSDASIEDQLRICRDKAATEGWKVVDSYTDRAISGASMMRPGLQSLLADAHEKLFDVVLTEALDRVSRNQADIATIYERLQFAGIGVVTLAEGEVNELHIGLKGTMGALFLKDLARKTHRGQQGRALAGKSAGGLAYGYKVARKLDGDGELIRGEREIDEIESVVINRICEDFADRGLSPRKIASALNAEGIPGPDGGEWTASTIHGNRRRGTGILNNELYIGVQVWNRLRYQKNPATGKRVSRMNDPGEWVRTEVPELRILDQDLWDRVKASQRELDAKPFATKKRPPKLFSYLLKCGECGGGFSKVSAHHYGCSGARNRGTCANRLTLHERVLEEKVLGALRTRLMEPKLCEVFCKEYTQHINRLRMESNATRARCEAELERTERAIAKLIEAIKAGCDPTLIKDEINGLQGKKEELGCQLEKLEVSPVLIHPNMAHRYHVEVQRLIASLNEPQERDESAKLVRSLVDKIVLTPAEDRSALVVDLYGHLAGILQMSEIHVRGTKANRLGLSRSMESEIEQAAAVAGLSGSFAFGSKVALVAGVGFEPTTFRL